MAAETQRDFEADPYRKEFEALIVETSALPQGQGVRLDRTLFYPEGGGQPADHGTLNGVAVVGVIEQDGAIVHEVEGSSFRPGETVRGILDWNRRFDHMQQHSGQHLLSQAFVRILNADTMSFHLGSEDATIDVHAADLTEESIIRVENEANGIVFENREVRIVLKSADMLDGVPLRKRPDLRGEVRLVEILDYDWSLCCGTHVRHTGEIGAIKILQWENYRGGTRVHFACGGRALRSYQSKSSLLKSLCRSLTAGEGEIAGIVAKWKEEKKIADKRLEVLLDKALDLEVRDLLPSARPAGNSRLVSVLFHDRDPREVQMLARKMTQSANLIAIVGTVQDRATVFFARSADVSVDMRLLEKAAAEAMNGKGGGSANWAQVSSENKESVEEGMRRAEEEIPKA
jgi:alanyl-tRNA synthetase